MTEPVLYRTIADLRAGLLPARRGGVRIAMVPTMGALHEGHLSLVRLAQQNARRVVVSIFVNPTQFAPTEDFASYPRTEAEDIAKLAALGVDAVFAPPVGEMYPDGFATAVSVGGPAQGLESDSRPHFFDGVALVVTKLLLAALPDVAVFGEKDYQQLCVVRRLVRDLNIPTEILAGATVREADGLAMSSRNVYLNAHEREAAAALPATMWAVAETLQAGADVEATLADGRDRLAAAGFKVDYLELRDAETLGPARPDSADRRLLVAAWLGRTRLIDNIAV